MNETPQDVFDDDVTCFDHQVLPSDLFGRFK